MPSWAPASCTLRWRIEPMARRARALPCSAIASSFVRRLAMSANSTATKKPLATSSSERDERGCGRSRGRLRAASRLGAAQPHRRHPVAVELDHLDVPPVVVEPLAHLGDPAQARRARSRPGSRSRPRARRSPQASNTSSRVQRARRAATPPARCTRVSCGVGRSCSSSISPTISSRTSSRVMMPGGPAVLVDDDGQVAAHAAQVGEQVGQVAGLRHHEGRHHQLARPGACRAPRTGRRTRP